MSTFVEPEIAYVAREVLHSLEYMHSNELVHRDVKTRNIMLSETGQIKLGACCSSSTHCNFLCLQTPHTFCCRCGSSSSI